MGETSQIAWCDSTINFWSGCTKGPAGCKNCYAEARDSRMLQEKVIHWGKGAPRLRSKGAVKDALALNRKPWVCECGTSYPTALGGKPECVGINGVGGCGGILHRRRIFSLSLGDWLDEEVRRSWFSEMLYTIFKCGQVIWILCTKRAENWRGRVADTLLSDESKNDSAFRIWVSDWLIGNAPKNIILLTSVENQEQADNRIPELLKIPAACRGLSVEPMLGPINLQYAAFNGTDSLQSMEGINWVIFGGESGPGARPCNVDWIRDGVKQCTEAGVAAFVKQLGALPVYTAAGIEFSSRDGMNNVRAHWNDPKWNVPWNTLHNQAPKITDKKGGDMSEWPVDLRIQEFPKL